MRSFSGRLKSPIKVHIFMLLIGWTAVVAFSLILTLYLQRESMLNAAATEARTHLALTIEFRSMITLMGGVYASVEKVIPNPYLNAPKKNITTTSGDLMTLLNPAYVTRLAFENIRKKTTSPVMNKLTSLQPVNPVNSPDEWERKILASFDRGLIEAIEVSDLRGESYLRLMQPLVTEKACLPCHAHQGYKEGDIRGGISIAVPLKPYYECAVAPRETAAGTHLIMWFIGSAGLLVSSRLWRKQEQQIIENEWKFRTVSESSESWEYWFSEKREIVYMSPSSRKITGYGAEEFAANIDLLSDIVYPADREAYQLHLNGLLDEPKELEFRIVTRDGQVRWIAHTCAPLYMENKFLGRRVSNRDITARKNAEDALIMSETRLREAQKLVNLGHWDLDLINNRLTWSDEVYRIFGLEPQEFPATYEAFLEMVHPRDRDIVDSAFNESLRKKKGYDIDHRILLKNGEIKYVNERCNTEYDENNRPVRSIGTVLDITEKRRLEDQLRHVQKMDALGTLASGVAHDFNNILSVIVGYGNMIEQKMTKDDPNIALLNEIQLAADRATQLTQGLLIFSRKEVSEMKPVNVNEVVNGMTKMVLRIIGDDIKTKISLASEPLTVLGDYRQLEQILLNFATNARDAMPDGGTLSIETGYVRMDHEFTLWHGFGAPGEYAHIAVSDTGKGMDTETMEKIFEPFFTTKDMGKGTGLGLSIVYGIVNRHKGYINCFSEPSNGTTFSVYFPLLDNPPAEKEEDAVMQIAGGTETILIADDNESVRKLTGEMLESVGYSVLEAKDGIDAVSQFAANREKIRLLLFDAIMPGRKGRDAYDIIKKMNPDIKVLFISGYSGEILDRQKITEDKLPYIQKPLMPHDLLTRIRSILDTI